MRISTGQMFHQNTTSILQKQTSTNKILDQLSTGKKINTAGDDPVAAIVIDNLIREITYEFDMTTVVITHDMNSVIEIGDNIVFIHQGQNWWEGNSKSIITTENKEILEFVYASDFMQEIRGVMQSKRV